MDLTCANTHGQGLKSNTRSRWIRVYTSLARGSRGRWKSYLKKGTLHRRINGTFWIEWRNTVTLTSVPRVPRVLAASRPCVCHFRCDRT